MAAWADYQITLKKGTTFFVVDYWVDERKVMFNAEGGMIGLPRETIKYIGMIEGTAPGVHKVIKTISFRTENEYQTADLKADLQERQVVEDPASLTEPGYREQAQALFKKKTKAVKAYKSAALAGEKKARYKARKKILALNKDLDQLLENVKAENGGEVPDWWEKEI